MQLDLIIFPMHDWKKHEAEGFRTRDAHLTREFERDERIRRLLFVNRPVSVSEHLLLKRPYRVASGTSVASWSNAWLDQVSEKIFILDQRVPELFMPLLRKRAWWHDIFTKAKTIANIRRAQQTLGIEAPVVFSWSPLSCGPVGQLEESLFVFDALDNWAIHPEMLDARREIIAGYDIVRTKADAIFVNSLQLREFLGTARATPSFIPNGVHVEMFQPRSDMSTPSDLARLPRPWLGYAGKIAKRVDVQLLVRLAQAYPKASLVLLGPVLDRKWVEPLKQCPNIHLLGDKHYMLLPSYVQAFDICLIPHNVGMLENGGDPIKLYEYVAAGKPVVTTPIAGVDVFADAIDIASTPEAFISAIDRILNQTGDEVEERARNLAAAMPEAYTWRFKARTMIDTLEEALLARSSQRDKYNE